MKKKKINLIALFILISIYPTQIVQGQDWSTPVDITDEVTENVHIHGLAICDPYENLHIFWVDRVPGEDGDAIFYRNNIDGVFSPPNDILKVNLFHIFYPDVTISPKTNTIHLTWVNSDGSLFYSSAPLIDAYDAKAWEPPTLIDTDVFDPAIDIGPDGKIHLIYSKSFDQETYFSIIHRISEDGITWENDSTIYSVDFQEPGFVRLEMAIDGKDRIHVGITSRSQEYAKIFEVGYIRSIDGGSTWDEYIVIENTSKAFQGTEWIAPYAFGENEIHLTWHNPERMHKWSSDGGNTWSTAVKIIELGAAFGGPNTLAKDSSGKIHSITAVLDGVYSSEWNGEKWVNINRIDNRPIDHHGQQIAICPANEMHTLYYDTLGNGTVWYAKRILDIPISETVRELSKIPTSTIPIITQATMENSSIQNTTDKTGASLGIEYEIEGTRISPLNIVFASALPVIILIIIILIFRSRK